MIERGKYKRTKKIREKNSSAISGEKHLFYGKRRSEHSNFMKEWHRTHEHPRGMLGKKHKIKTIKKMIKNHKGFLGKHHTEEAKRKILHKGENHWNWKGGITPAKKKIWCSVKYQNWRKDVFERDKWICQNPNCPFCENKRSANLEAHHIKRRCKFPELIFDVNNGITYCEGFHINFHVRNGWG